MRRGLLYLGTEGGLYVSFDDGGHWQDFQSDMPRAPVYWLTVQERFSDLVIATYGRGFYIVDDISPLRTMNAEIDVGRSCISSRCATRTASARWRRRTASAWRKESPMARPRRTARR